MSVNVRQLVAYQSHDVEKCKFGTLTGDLHCLWQKLPTSRIEKELLPASCIQSLFNEMHIYPSTSQVHEMISCATECAQRSPNGISFGEFCVFAAEMKSSYENNLRPPSPLSKIPDECVTSAKRPKRSVSSSSSNYEVFLGGSCNPTTWRKDIAIPFLKECDITYYNPQVSNWGPELMELENQAKQNADVMFFVIDNQTRCVASIIEAAHLAGSRRKLILVINSFSGPGCKVLGEGISEREYEDLRIGQAHLQDLVERQNIPVFGDPHTALRCTSKVVKEGIAVQDLTLSDGAKPVKMSHLRLGEKIIKLRKIFSTLDTNGNGLIDLHDVCLAIRILTGKDLSSDSLQKIYQQSQKKAVDAKFECKNGLSETMRKELNNRTVNFDQFCCIVVEYKYQLKNDNNRVCGSIYNRAINAFHSIARPVSSLLSWAMPRRTQHHVISSHHRHHTCSQGNNRLRHADSTVDIFLGGSYGDSLWREEIAVPTLKKHGLSYYNPKVDSYSERLIPIHLAAVEKSRVLLFVITNQTRSLSNMAIAAHYAGLGCQMVLCIQYLAEDAFIGNEKLSKNGVKDYNRGRVYLSDLANRDGIPVFDDIQEATNCSIDIVLNL